MNRFTNLSLRIQLLLLALLLTLPAFGAIILSGLNERKYDLKIAAHESQELADSIAAEQQHMVSRAEILGNLIEQLPELKNRNIPRLNHLLGIILNKNPQYQNIFVTDRSGVALASAVPLSQPFSVADRSYFKKGAASRRFSSGEYAPSNPSNEPTLAMGYPLFSSGGEFTGAIVFSFELEFFKPLLKAFGSTENSNYLVVDRKGIVLSRGSDEEGHVGAPARYEVFRKMVVGPDILTYHQTRRDGDKRIVTHRKLWLPGETEPYMYVLAGVSAREALAHSNNYITFCLLVLIPFVVAAFLLTLLIGKRSIADRVTALDAAARELARGSLPGKVADLVKGGELGSLGQTFDEMATQLTAREKALQASEAHYRAMIDAFDGFIYICSADMRVQFMSERMKEWLGYDATGGVCYEAFHDMDSICPWCRHEEVFAGQSVQWELQCPKNDRWYNVANTAIHNPDGTIAKQAMLTDITERKSVEEKLQRQTLLLEREVVVRQKIQEELVSKQVQLEALNLALEESIDVAIADLRKKDRMLIHQSRHAAMGEMINSIAHQWRQPLNNISLIVQNLLLSYEMGTLTEDEMRHWVDKAKDTIQFMSRTIDDFRFFFRQDKEKQEFSINEVLDRTINFVSASLKNSNIVLEIEVVNGVNAVGYPNEYSQVLLNILNNAKDALTERRVAEPQIRIQGMRERGRAVVRIWDNGGGIPQEILPQIFDPYFSTKEIGKGTGIGLYMSKVIIEQNMGGWLTALNTDGGVEFRIEV